jgi:hypothetical protein
MAVITLTSDFGWQDGYVAAMKGVILSICPAAVLVDVAHDVPPQDVRHAGFVLHTAAQTFPPGTVHLAVVDPGVGTERRAVAVQTERAVFVAPDNGLLSLALAGAGDFKAVHISNPSYHRRPVSTTFHGRDIFAPAAAYLANGVPLGAFGPEVRDLVRFAVPGPVAAEKGGITGEAIHIDRFGNVITNVRVEHGQWDRFAGLKVGRRKVDRMCNAYGEAAPGELIVLIGSSGYLEVAQRDGNAARRLGAEPGTAVRIMFREPDTRPPHL